MSMLEKKIPGVVSMGQGIPSFDTPDEIKNKVVEFLKSGKDVGKYTASAGSLELRKEIAKRFKKEKRIDADPEKELMITVGCIEASIVSILAFINEGDEVIIPSPNYPLHINQVLIAGGTPVFSPLIEEEGWRLDIDSIKKSITKKTKMILLTNPMNPTGSVFPKQKLEELAEIVIENDLLILSDETYDYLVFDGKKFFSIASIPELKERAICCFSFSKEFAMTGWRVGYVYSSSEIIRSVRKIHPYLVISAPTISQIAAMEALRSDREFVRESARILEKRRNLICERLDKVDNIFEYQRPKGAYYVFPRYKSKNLDSYEFAKKLIFEAKVSTIPGKGFGPTGENHVRMCVSEENINKAFDRIEKFKLSV